MPAMDDLPKMVSLSPGPLADNNNLFEKKMAEKPEPVRRHNWDADVIEALWQQDVDLGLTLHDFDPVRSPAEEEPVQVTEKASRLDDEWDFSKAPKPSDGVPVVDEEALDIWAGLDYTIDSETGEYMLLPAPSASTPAPTAAASTATAASAAVVPSTGGQLNPAAARPEEPLLAAPIPTTIDELIGAEATPPRQPPLRSQDASGRLPHFSGDSGRASLADSDSDSGSTQMALLDQLIEAAQSQTVRTQPAVPLMRMVSMEQRWQDLASVLLLPGQEAASPPLTPANATDQQLQTSFSSATGMAPVVSPAMSATGPQTSPVPAGGATGDLTYYQLAPAAVTSASAAAPEMAPPLDQEAAFLSQLLGVGDIDMNDVPITLAPQEWSSGSQGVGGSSPPSSDQISSSRPDLSDSGSFRSSSSSPSGSGSGSDSGFGSGSGSRPPRLPVAQKKHHMYGKRAFQSQDGSQEGSSPGGALGVSPSPPSPPAAVQRERYGAEGGPLPRYPPPHTPAPSEAATTGEAAEVKFSRTAHFGRASPAERLSPVAHNHTYHQPDPIESASDGSRPVARDKSAEEPRKTERLSRDEKRTRAMNIPLSAEEIVHLPMDEFNERLAKHQLTEAQLSLIRDVRRRGKNKLAAQNCRKRKLDQINSLTEEVQKVREQRQRTLTEHQRLAEERARIRDKYARLHQHVFQSLRDADNRPYSPSEYSLQLSADGAVLLVPRAAARGAAIVPGPLPGAARDRPE